MRKYRIGGFGLKAADFYILTLGDRRRKVEIINNNIGAVDSLTMMGIGT